MKIAEVLRLTGEAFLNALYPPHCANCLADTPSGIHLCAKCAAQAPKIKAPYCSQCSQPFEGAIDGIFVCSQCDGRNLPFDCAVAPYRSRGVVREFIHRFKYERHFYLRQPLANWLSEALEDQRITDQPFDFLVPVPLHSARYRERDFNQADVLWPNAPENPFWPPSSASATPPPRPGSIERNGWKTCVMPSACDMLPVCKAAISF